MDTKVSLPELMYTKYAECFHWRTPLPWDKLGTQQQAQWIEYSKVVLRTLSLPTDLCEKQIPSDGRFIETENTLQDGDS